MGKVWLPLSVTPPGQIQEAQAGQLVTNVRIENPTGAYWYIPQALTFIQPYVTGRVIRLPTGTQKFSALFQAPIDLQEPPNSAFANSPPAVFILTDEDNPPDSGTLLGGSSANREFVILTPVAGVVTYTLPRPAPNGITMTIYNEGALAAPVQGTVSGGILTSGSFGRINMFTQNTYSLDSQQNHAVFRYPHPIPGQSFLSLTVPVSAAPRVRLAF